LRKALNIFVPHCSGMLTDHQPHGDGLVAYGFIKRLAERGHSLFVVAENVNLSTPLPDNVHLFPIQYRFRSSALNRLDYMMQLRSLYHRLQRVVHFDLVHQLNPVYTGITLALWPLNVPVVLGPYVADWPANPDAISSSRSSVSSILRRVKRAAAHLQQKRATALLLTTEAARDRLVNSDPRGKSTYILPHGIDSDFFCPSPGRPLRSESSVILFLANISERKGIFDLLVAFDRIAAKFPGASLLIAGGGEHEQDASKLASGLACARQIHFLGRQTRQQALEAFRNADIYCLPSHGEPFGMTVAEAMSCGLPVVVTNAGGVRWIVDDDGGLRVPERSPEDLARALSELLLDPGRRQTMGAHNRAKVLKLFTWERVIDQLEEIYTQSLRIRKRADLGEVLDPGRISNDAPQEVSAYE